jgi:protein CpxP
MSRKLLYIIAVSLSLILSPVAFANKDKCGKGMGEMVDSLRLDDAQKAKAQPILDQLKASMKDSVVQIKEVSGKIHEQMKSGTMDQATMNGLIDQKSKIIGDMMKAKVTAKAQIYGLLNDEQKTKFQDILKKKEEKMAEKFKGCPDED